MKKTRTGYEQSELTAMGAALPEVFAAKQWGTQWRLFRLGKEWPGIVGDQVAQLTSPAFFRRETLWIFVQDSAWMHHLQYVKADLLARVNRHLEGQSVTDIRWRLHPHPLPQPERCFPEPREIDPEREKSFCLMSEAVANQECREALQRLWRTFAAIAE
ncbi:MAG: DUF721 domain-containing protein [Desulfobulbus sp.]|nr:DUF721 domain-containing protein [Desulfobulbus sp.]